MYKYVLLYKMSNKQLEFYLRGKRKPNDKTTRQYFFSVKS